MFVSKKRLLAAEAQIKQARADAELFKAMKEDSDARHMAMVRQWNELAAVINKRGGHAFLNGSTPPITQFNQFDASEIDKLINLCHPDKHNGKPMATEMTQKLLQLRKK